mgnify:CR=1 FL=1
MYMHKLRRSRQTCSFRSRLTLPHADSRLDPPTKSQVILKFIYNNSECAQYCVCSELQISPSSCTEDETNYGLQHVTQSLVETVDQSMQWSQIYKRCSIFQLFDKLVLDWKFVYWFEIKFERFCRYLWDFDCSWWLAHKPYRQWL